MAAKGGGAWKVAYADFVTAMMAFFLVMWICAQDQKIKEAVARYFNNPLGLSSEGTSKKPDRTGSIFKFPSTGEVPKGESVILGRGRHSYTVAGQNGRSTKLVGDWLSTDDKATEYWRKQAQQARAQAANAKDVRNKRRSLDDVASLQLANQLKDEITREISSQVQGLHQDLLFEALGDVNWMELAEDMLANLVPVP